MALDLNATLEVEGEQVPDLNKSPGEQDVHAPFEVAVGPGDINEPQTIPGFSIEAIGVGDEQVGGTNHTGHHFHLNHGETEEQQSDIQGDNAGYAFDSDHTHEGEEDNLHAHDDDIDLLDEQDTMEFGEYTNDFEFIFDEEELPQPADKQGHNQQEAASIVTKNLTEKQRQEIYEDLLQHSKNGNLKRNSTGNLKRNSTTVIAAKYGVHVRTVQWVWQRAKKCRAQGIAIDVGSLKHKNGGRKQMEVDLSRVVDIPLNRRGTIRSLASALDVNKSTIHRLFKAGMLRRHSSSLKPYLKEENKKERLRWCLSMLDPSTLPHNLKFREMENIIHSDEKWFNGTKKNKTMYMHPDEEDPHRTVQNKNAIHKVMFYASVAKPRFDDEGTCYFNGRLGIWPFVRKEPAQRRSGNRPRGTPITKTMKVDRCTMRSYMITYLLPAIKARWPQEDRHKTIWIQQDNVPSHVPADDAEFATAVATTGLDIRLTNQPANSPDMNCLDLGFFNSLQSLTNRISSRNMDDLIRNVNVEYENYKPILLNRVFLTLQSCMIEVMKDNGGNKYKIPHMNKEGLEAVGMLPKTLSCDSQVVQRALDLLNN